MQATWRFTPVGWKGNLVFARAKFKTRCYNSCVITQIILPQLGDTMGAGTITRWFKQEGDAVKQGEPLFEVLTDKANVQVEATATGYLRKILYGENASAPTGQVIAYLTTSPDEAIEMPGAVEKASAVVSENVGFGAHTPARAVVETTTLSRRKPFISPRARRVAQEFGVDVSQLAPTSKTGRIMEADVRKYLAQAKSQQTLAAAPVVQVGTQPSADVVQSVSGVRKIIYDRMGASAREIARVTLTTEADATRLVELRDEMNAAQSEMRFGFTDFLILLVSRALLKYPYMNATLRDDGVHQHAFVNLGVATDTERGLLVPVVRDADRKGLREIYTEVQRLSEAARSGNISPADLQGGTFTITNLGTQEIDAFTPIVNQPEIAILGIGRIAQKPAAYQGQLALRWMVSLSLSFDHRVVDGAPAGKFLQHVKHLIETPGLVLI